MSSVFKKFQYHKYEQVHVYEMKQELQDNNCQKHSSFFHGLHQIDVRSNVIKIKDEEMYLEPQIIV